MWADGLDGQRANRRGVIRAELLAVLDDPPGGPSGTTPALTWGLAVLAAPPALARNRPGGPDGRPDEPGASMSGTPPGGPVDYEPARS